MRAPVRLAWALPPLLCAGFAHGQSNLGEIQEKGARKLGEREVVRLLSGSTVRGINAQGSEMSVDYKADGTLVGAVLPQQGKRAGQMAGIYGLWRVEKDGKFCTSTTNVAAQRNFGSCGYYFEVGGEYFIAASYSDPKAKIRKRVIERK